jgi:hypothetical protein
MGSDAKTDQPEVSVEGAHAATHGDQRWSRTVHVPVGLEMLLYRAARDEAFRQRLLADREAAIREAGVRLRSSERATLDAIDDRALGVMIDRVVPENPHGRSFMTKVATAVTTLAAGTAAASSCTTEKDTPRSSTVEEVNEPRPVPAGINPETLIDGGLSDFDEPVTTRSSASSADDRATTRGKRRGTGDAGAR